MKNSDINNKQIQKRSLFKLVIIICSIIFFVLFAFQVIYSYFELKQKTACHRIMDEARAVTRAFQCYMAKSRNEQIPTLDQLKKNKQCRYVPQKDYIVNIDYAKLDANAGFNDEIKVTVKYIGKFSFLKGMECKFGKTLSIFLPSNKRYWDEVRLWR